jgi:hypothetical protein
MFPLFDCYVKETGHCQFPYVALLLTANKDTITAPKRNPPTCAHQAIPLPAWDVNKPEYTCMPIHSSKKDSCGDFYNGE